MIEVVLTTGAIRRAVKLSPPTNKQPTFYYALCVATVNTLQSVIQSVTCTASRM